jgi:hypothetical protein
VNLSFSKAAANAFPLWTGKPRSKPLLVEQTKSEHGIGKTPDYTLSTGLNFIDTRPPTLEPGLLQTLGILNNLIQKIQMHDF